MRRIATCVVMVVLAMALAAPGFSAVYFWKDEKGVVHMTDRKPEETGAKVEVIGKPEQTAKKGTREEKIAEMQKAAASHPRFLELSAIARDYNKNHTYSTADYFVCIDMALEMANVLKTKGFLTIVVSGTTKADLSTTPRDKFGQTIDHAWVVVELTPGVYAPIETTAGVIVTDRIPNSIYYYQGLFFENSRQAKDAVGLIHSSNEACKAAKDLADNFNAKYGTQGVATPQLIEDKGRTEGKIKDCVDNKKKYADLMNRIYRTLY